MRCIDCNCSAVQLVIAYRSSCGMVMVVLNEVRVPLSSGNGSRICAWCGCLYVRTRPTPLGNLSRRSVSKTKDRFARLLLPGADRGWF